MRQATIPKKWAERVQADALPFVIADIKEYGHREDERISLLRKGRGETRYLVEDVYPILEQPVMVTGMTIIEEGSGAEWFGHDLALMASMLGYKTDIDLCTALLAGDAYARLTLIQWRCIEVYDTEGHACGPWGVLPILIDNRR